MSRTKRARHQDKLDRQVRDNQSRWFPDMSLAEIEARIDLAHNANHLIADTLTFALTNNLVPDEQQMMFGAHFTIGRFAAERTMHIYERERRLALAESQSAVGPLVTPVKGIVGPDGKTVIGND